MSFDRAAYLARIGYDGPLHADIDTLRALHRAHVYHVPFENLDIHLGRPIRIDTGAVFDKIVRQGRGGFCYELNGLLAHLLIDLGYQVTLVSARSANDDGSFSAEFDHLALLVACPGRPEERWLADVGWGDGPLEPLRLEEPGVQVQGPRAFRITGQEDYLLLTEQHSADAWLKHYRFDRIPRRIEEFEGMCRYHQTSPESMFTQKRLCSLFTPEGRVTLSEQRLVTTRYGAGPRAEWQREERELDGEAEVFGILSQVFGVKIS